MSDPITPVQKRGKDTRARLIESARVIIPKYGRDRFTTNQIADHAGLSIGILYRYFPDRVAVLYAAFPNTIEGLADETTFAIDRRVVGVTSCTLEVDGHQREAREVYTPDGMFIFWRPDSETDDWILDEVQP